MPQSVTLIILGHGSSKHPESSASVRQHAELIRKSGDYADVRVAFLKEDLFVDHCMDGVETEHVIIVPDFLAEGYFTRQVIPEKLNLSARDENMVYCPPVGTHPMMATLIDEAAAKAAGDWSVAETSLMVIGHGSGRNPCSKQTLLHHLEEIRSHSAWAHVQDLWLEEPPRVEDWMQIARQKQVVVVPYLLNDGQHGGWDIPADLGVQAGSPVHGVTHELGEYHVRITPALGTSAKFAEAITSLVTLWANR